MRTGRENPADVGVAVEASLVADKAGSFNRRWSDYHAVEAGAGNQNQARKRERRQTWKPEQTRGTFQESLHFPHCGNLTVGFQARSEKRGLTLSPFSAIKSSMYFPTRDIMYPCATEHPISGRPTLREHLSDSSVLRGMRTENVPPGLTRGHLDAVTIYSASPWKSRETLRIGLERALSLLLLLSVVGMACSLNAAIITLTPAADTTLFQNTPNNNLGAEPTFVSGTTTSALTNRALLKFDIAGNIPSNATIQNVTLTLTVTRTIASQPSLFDLHRVLRGWSEGAGINPNTGNAGGSTGAPATNGETTFLARFYPNTLWSQPGAAAPLDFSPTVSATQMIDQAGSYAFNSSGLAREVQNWLTNAAANFGWILICEDELTFSSARRFGSREDPANTPSLFIEYTLPSRPVVTLAPVADTSLFENDPNYNLGAASLVAGTIGEAGGGRRTRALIRFASTDFPSPAAFTSAGLTLKVVVVPSGGGPATSIFDLHRLLQPWGEGDKVGARGSPADPGEASWDARFSPLVLWSTPGASAPGDFSAAVSSRTLISGLGSYLFTNVLADVRFWQAHPDQNFGWILISEDEVTLRTARRFGSREDPDNASALELEYIPLPKLAQLAVSESQFQFSFVAQAGQAYIVQCSDSLSPDSWATVTNLPVSLVTQTNIVSAPVTGHQSFYRISLP